MRFKEKVVIVTGASSGVGAATAIAFTREGASVVMIGRKQNKLDEVKAKCEAIGKPPLVINADLTEDEQLVTIVRRTIDRFGKIDILVNNAAILRRGQLTEDPHLRETYDDIMNTNLRAAVFLTTHAVPHLIASKGNIVNISTTGAERVTWTGYNAYCASKAALNHFTRAASLELGTHGVRVNTVSPSIVRSDLRKNGGLEEYDIDEGELIGMVTEPEEVADFIMFIVSDKAKAITGSNYVIHMGWL